MYHSKRLYQNHSEHIQTFHYQIKRDFTKERDQFEKRRRDQLSIKGNDTEVEEGEIKMQSRSYCSSQHTDDSYNDKRCQLSSVPCSGRDFEDIIAENDRIQSHDSHKQRSKGNSGESCKRSDLGENDGNATITGNFELSNEFRQCDKTKETEASKNYACANCLRLLFYNHSSQHNKCVGSQDCCEHGLEKSKIGNCPPYSQHISPLLGNAEGCWSAANYSKQYSTSLKNNVNHSSKMDKQGSRESKAGSQCSNCPCGSNRRVIEIMEGKPSESKSHQQSKPQPQRRTLRSQDQREREKIYQCKLSPGKKRFRTVKLFQSSSDFESNGSLDSDNSHTTSSVKSQSHRLRELPCKSHTEKGLEKALNSPRETTIPASNNTCHDHKSWNGNSCGATQNRLLYNLDESDANMVRLLAALTEGCKVTLKVTKLPRADGAKGVLKLKLRML